MTGLFPIPDSWAWTTLGEIAEVVGGVTKDSKKQNNPSYPQVPYLRVANVQRGYLDLEKITKIRVPEQTVDKLRLQPGDVLLNEGGDRDKLGRGWVWNGEIPNCIHQNHVFRARPIGGILEPKLLAWYMNECARHWFELNATQSVNLASISKTKIQQLPVPLPSPAEQHRIVAALEEHLSHLDKANSCIYTALKRKRLLANRLVDVRIETFHKTSRSLLSILREPLINGRSVPTDSNGFPVLRLTALQEGRLVLSERKGGRWTAADAAPFIVRKGDFFISRGNGSLSLLGRGALLDENPDPVAFPDTMVRIRIDEQQMSSEFLRIIWGSRWVRTQIEGAARTTAGIYKINQRIIEAIRVPVPKLSTQEQIVAEAREAMGSVERLNGQIQDAAINAKRLHRSLMIEAFAGRLVKQDSADEPASVLLKRSRAKRPAKGSGRRGAAAGKRSKDDKTVQKETLL